jgi:peptide deformylase
MSELSEAQKFVKDYVGVSDEEFNKLSNEQLLDMVKVKMKEKMEGNPDEMKLVYHPSKSLREKCQEVTTFTEEIKKFGRQLLIFCRRHGGLGLAAPQVNFPLRIIAVDTDILDHFYKTEYRKLDYPQVLFNPVITNTSGKIRYKEGCLSVPGAFAWVNRHEKFTLTYQDENGTPKSLEITCSTGNPYGVVIQHEVDHLDGIEFIDNLNFIEKEKVTKMINKLREKK